MFHIGQRVRLRMTNKATKGAIGTVIGYYMYISDDEDEENEDFEWSADESDLLIRFDDHSTILTSYRDWDNQRDCSHPVGDLYIDAYYVEPFIDGDPLEIKRQAIETRHNEYKKRMSL